jgi:hypothetical protein
MDKTPKDLITTREAIRILGISSNTFARLCKNGEVARYENPLDARTKLVSRAAVLKLKEPRKAAA